MTKANLLWIDLEMTGLDPMRDRILEVAAIATDFNLREIAWFEAVVKCSPSLMKRRMVGEFWNKYHETRETLMSQNMNGQSARAVENGLLAFLDKNFDNKQPVYLAGNSIHQDQKFIEHEWPRLNARLHYRQLDVTAWKIMFENHGVKFAKPEVHRAMSDIEGSIEELRYYLKRVK
jgi:oligoribonuclease